MSYVSFFVVHCEAQLDIDCRDKHDRLYVLGPKGLLHVCQCACRHSIRIDT